MENPKAQAIQRIKEANNVLVTVSNNPSVDQLAGAIGLTLLLNKLGKHATAVFSGSVPSTIEFLKPESTLKSNTDSLRDFIIALDKSKADKLRYKIEDQHVKIFITPYKSTITQDDLEFSHGDLNVDVVVALGVHEQSDMDSAIVAHGRILHNATVISINNTGNSGLGSINWVDPNASSLCEMLVVLGEALKSDVFDTQMSTALLTGVVAETDRFSNQKTTALTMSISAKLMVAGANQQLVATQLQVLPEAPARTQAKNKPDDGALSIKHDKPAQNSGDSGSSDSIGRIHIDEHGKVHDAGKFLEENPPASLGQTTSGVSDQSTLPSTSLNIVSSPPPESSVTLAPDTTIKPPKETTDPLMSLPSVEPLAVLGQDDAGQAGQMDKANAGSSSADDLQTLDEIEKAVDSPHLDTKPKVQSEEQSPQELDNIRKAVEEAAQTGPDNALPKAELRTGSTPVNLDLGHDENQAGQTPADTAPRQDYLDVSKLDNNTGLPADNSALNAGNPPPVPPPMMPPTGSQYGQQPLPNAEDDSQPQDPLAPI